MASGSGSAWICRIADGGEQVAPRLSYDSAMLASSFHRGHEPPRRPRIAQTRVVRGGQAPDRPESCHRCCENLLSDPRYCCRIRVRRNKCSAHIVPASIVKCLREATMGLSWQQGPLSAGALGRFLVPEPLPKRL